MVELLYKNILFDLDGTLIDSALGIINSFDENSITIDINGTLKAFDLNKISQILPRDIKIL